MKNSPRAWLAAALIPWPFLVSWAAELSLARAEEAAAVLGRMYGRATATATALPPPPPVNPEVGLSQPPSQPSASSTAVRAPRARAGHGRRPPHRSKRLKSRASAPRGIFVGARRIAQLSRHARIPTAPYVPAKGPRPAGLLLDSIVSLGVGVAPGDVLTHVSGAPVASLSDVVQRVLSARARAAPRVSGVVWRHQRAMPVVVEMPYMTAGAATTSPRRAP